MKSTLTVRVAVMAGLAAGLAGWVLAQAGAPPAAPAKDARPNAIEHIKVHGKSLESNLLGDSPDRDVFVYLPPSYQASRNRRYPVVYLLHGYGLNAERWVPFIGMPSLADKDFAAGTAKEMILVSPDAYNKYDGSMYSSSPTNGDWETFITQELVAYIDSHYRTFATRESRGLAGHSMGGYGTWRLAMKYPEVYSSIYAMSSCCLMNNPQPPGAGRGGAGQGAAKQAPATNDKGGKGAAKGGRGRGFANVQFAEGAAWSSNPKKPPLFFDLPTEDGKFDPNVAAEWVANSPLAMVGQYLGSFKTFKAIAMDVGLQDNLSGSNRELDALLTQFGIPHTFETYEGTHTSNVKDRFEQKVLPFFSTNLSFTPVKAKAQAKH